MGPILRRFYAVAVLAGEWATVTAFRIDPAKRGMLSEAIRSALDAEAQLGFVMGVDESSAGGGKDAPAVEAVAMTEWTIPAGSVVLSVRENFPFSLRDSEDQRLVKQAKHSGCGTSEAFAAHILLGKVPARVARWYEMMPDLIHNYMSLHADEKKILEKSYFKNLGQTLEAELACTKYVLEKVNGTFADAEITKALVFVSLASQALGNALMPVSLAFAPAPALELANVVQDTENPLVFRAARDIKTGELLTIDLGSMGNLETLLRFGFEVAGNINIGRAFDLTGEPAQSKCPAITLRNDASLVSKFAFECHRLARIRSFTAQFGSITEDELDKEETAIRHTIAEACHQMRDMTAINVPHERMKRSFTSAIGTRILELVDAEMNTLVRCEREFLYRKPLATAKSASYAQPEFNLFMETFDLVAKRGPISQ